MDTGRWLVKGWRKLDGSESRVIDVPVPECFYLGV